MSSILRWTAWRPAHPPDERAGKHAATVFPTGVGRHIYSYTNQPPEL